MSDRLRWILILGCAVVAVLHAPTAASLIAESWSGPYAAPRARGAHGGSTALVAPAVARDAEPTVTAPNDDELDSTDLESNVAMSRDRLARGF